MNSPTYERRVSLAGSALSLCALCVALFVEAVSEAGVFEFSSIVSWGEFESSIRLVRPQHFRIGLPDVIALLGMVAALSGTLFTRCRLPTLLLLAYLVIFALFGGIYGLIAIAFGWFYAPIDGEYFQDGVPRLLAYGIWLAFLFALAFLRFAARPTRAEQIAAADRH